MDTTDIKLDRIKGGWAARGDGWAVHGATEDEAIRRYQEAVEKHREILARPDRPYTAPPQDAETTPHYAD